MPAPASNSDQVVKPGCVSTSPRRVQFLQKRLTGWMTLFEISGPKAGSGQVRRLAAPDVISRSRGAMRPGFANFWPAEIRGHREDRVHAAPAVSCASCTQKTHTSIQVQRRQSGLPCAVVYGLLRAPPGERAFLPPSPLRSLLPKNLTPASGCQDHTTSPYAPRALVCRAHRVHRISPQRS